MRTTTKDKLYNLARIIASDYNVKDLVGSNEFINIAFHENEENDIELSRELLTKYEGEFKRIALRIENDIIEQLEEPLEAFKEEEEVPLLDPFEMDSISDSFMLEEKRLVAIINFYSDGTFEKITPLKEKTTYDVRIPDYTMFAEGEDGYIVTRGAYRDKYVHEIDLGSWVGCAAGWANKILNDNERLGADRNGALTSDDIVVLNKIKQNKLGV
jgi:hypothetical protein